MNSKERSDIVRMEIENFIFYAFSDDNERKQFMQCLDYFMHEVYEV